MHAIECRRVWLGAICALLAGFGAGPVAAQQPAGAGIARNTAPDEAASSPVSPAAPGNAVAEEASPASPDATRPAPPLLRVADLTWLQGQWTGAWGPRTISQVWAAPKAGTMVGTLQEVEGGKTLVIELVTLTDTTNGIQFRERRFTPALTPWETSAPTILNLMSVDGKKVVFQNESDEGKPQQIILMHPEPDTYINRWEVLPQTGDPQPVEVTFHRQKTSAGSGAHR